MLFSLGIDRYMINKHMFTAGDLVMKYEDRKMRKRKFAHFHGLLGATEQSNRFHIFFVPLPQFLNKLLTCNAGDGENWFLFTDLGNQFSFTFKRVSAGDLQNNMCTTRGGGLADLQGCGVVDPQGCGVADLQGCGVTDLKGKKKTRYFEGNAA